MTLRKIFLSVMIALTGIIPLAPHAFAQDANRIAALKISIWPEYDRPNVLVLLDGTLADKANLPREISVSVPKNAQVFVTTWQNPDGSLAPEQPNKETDTGDGFKRVAFTISQPSFRVEYYDDLLTGTPDRALSFAFKAASQVDQVTLEIQQPLKATNLTVSPPAQTTRNDSDGFKYFTSQFGALAVGQTLAAQAKYTKSDPNPSINAAAAPSANAPVTTPAATDSTNLLVLVAIVSLGIAAVLGFMFYQQRATAIAATQTARRMSPKQYRRAKQRAKRSADATSDASDASAFCTQCGRGMADDDQFCPKCGTPRRAVS